MGAYDARNWAIWVAERDGSRPHVVLRGGHSPAFSPDGKRLAAGVLIGGDREIVSIRIDGDDLRRLTHRPGEDYLPTWSPDGSFLVFSGKVDKEEISLFRVGADGGDLRRLTRSGARDYNPVFSPDGKRVVFYREVGDNHDQVWTLDLAGSTEKRITDGTGHNIFPTFLPDGRIAYSGQPDGGERRLFVVSADGARHEALGPPRIFFASWSPDGRDILYLIGGGPPRISRMKADGAESEELLDVSHLDDAPSARPAGPAEGW